MAGEDRALVLAPGEGRAIDLGPFGMTVKASWDETDGVFSLLEAEEPPGPGAEPDHRVERREQAARLDARGLRLGV